MKLSLEALKKSLNFIRESPDDSGIIELMCIRPAVDERLIVESAKLSTTKGMAGDNWRVKPSSSMPNGEPHPAKQLTLMNSRAITAIAVNKDRWALAGDQIYVDMNLSYSNIPPGTKLQLGTAVIEISEPLPMFIKPSVPL